MDRLRDEMRVVFDRPTPYTLNSLRMVPARKDRLEARVWFKDEADGAQPASVWIAPEVYGGPRRNKPAELQPGPRGSCPKVSTWCPAPVLILIATGISGGVK